MSEQQSGTLGAFFLSGLLAAGAGGFGDELLPFYSVSFVLGVAACFYYAVTHGPRPALYIGVAVVVAFLLRALGEGGDAMTVALYQAPALALFFLGFAALPRALPRIIAQEAAGLSREVTDLSRKVEELKKTLADEHKEKVKDKGSEAKEEVIKVTSRTTQLNTFLREILQAASTKEIFNLLFSNTTKAYGGVEVGLVLILGEGEEMIISRAAHSEHESLENHRFPAGEVAILESATRRTAPILLPERMVLFEAQGFGARVIIPVVIEGKCEALLTLGKTRGGVEPTTQDAQFLGTFAELTSEAIAQMKVVLAS